MTIQKQFSKYSNKYDNNNIIQRIVSKALVREIKINPTSILELGCGTGQIYKEINNDKIRYKALDFSQEMCDNHPNHINLEVLCLDFDSDEFYQNIKNDKYDLILSSSALQWSKDLKLLLKKLKTVSKEINAVLFTSNTFKSIYNITEEKSTILSVEDIKNAFDTYDSNYEILNYEIKFDTKKELFNYIKNSGVQGEVKLSYGKAKELYNKYELNYLEFEVIFVRAKLNV